MLIKIPSIKFRNVIEELNDHICIEIRLTLRSSILSLSFSLMIKDTTLKDETNVHDAMQFNIDSIYNPFNTERNSDSVC